MTIDHDAISRAQAAIENGLIEALQSQAQADMDGTTVIVSRQACDEAAEFLPALYDEVKRLRADLRHVIDERDATFALMLARAEKAEAERDALLAAGDRLSVCAQTTGGTAGRDDGLVAAITGWKEARQALKGHNQ